MLNGDGVIDAGEAQNLARYLKETGGRDDKISAETSTKQQKP